MELILLARAEAEVLETQARLEDVAIGLGERFNTRVEEALEQLIEFPQIGSIYFAPYRRLLVRDFPFGVFYAIDGRRIIVHTVLDLRQSPEAIARKLRPA
jgi:hypothetical protein